MSGIKRYFYSRFELFVKQNKGKYITGAVAIFLVNIIALIIPRITGNTVDALDIGAIDNNGLLKISALIVLLALLVFFMHYISRLMIIGTSSLYEMLVRNELFKHLEKLSMSFFNRKSVGEIMALSTNDLNAVRMTLGRGIIMLLNTVFLIVSSIVIVGTTIDFKLTILAFAPFPVLIFIIARFGGVINKRFRKVQESFAHITRKAQENISGIRVVKAFNQEKNEIKSFEELNMDNYKAGMSLVRVWGLFFPLITFLSAISFFITMYFGGPLVIKGTITLGDFIAFNSYIGMIIRPVGFIGMIINQVQQGRASMERIEKLFQERPDVSDKEGFGKLERSIRLNRTIEFNNVTFSYGPSKAPALNNVSFKIKSGQTAAFIGSIGSGKTTIAELILRFYNPPGKGLILIGDVDILDIPLNVLRDNIGYVPQDNILFSASIKDNIGFNPYETDIEEVLENARISHVYNNIIEFPDKFDTMLGERGVNLSGGQKQRVSIARALTGNPGIIILDDAMSAVDTQTEEMILVNLKSLMRDKTGIIIAHRISTIKEADIIFVMDEGKIVERGTHIQLLNKRGYYSRIYERQLLEDKIDKF